ncbi:unnamed protein product [Rotaria sp. Silwood1]|nr:unnamed protein product [Rotaria sp. Silwood1]
MATSTRIFSFGLGHSPSRSLVKGLARATNGRFVFIPPNSNVDVHIGKQLQKALQSCITNIQVEWKLGTTVMTAPTNIPPVYVNDRLIVYALANDPMFVFNDKSSVELRNDQIRLGQVKIDCIPNVNMNGIIARLAAKALILELQHSKSPLSIEKRKLELLLSCFGKTRPSPTLTTTTDEKRMTKKSIIDLSLKYQILSPHTAFIGVEKRMNGSNADMVLREVPIQISADDQHLQEPFCMNRSLCSMPYKMVLHHATSLQNQKRPMEIGLPQYGKMKFYAFASISQVNLFSEYSMDKSLDFNLQDDNSSHRVCDRVLSSNISLPQDCFTRVKDEVWPIDDENIVRYLINKQKFDGLWDLDANDIELLTGKPLTSFTPFNNKQILISAIIIVVLETRFATMSIMWHGTVQKARKHLFDLLGKDAKELELLLENIRQQF